MAHSERNPTMYQGKDLRGKRFTDENFAGYDFSHTDLRGTKFKRCNLRSANFSHARLGALAERDIAVLEARISEKEARIHSQEKMITTLLDKDTVNVHVGDGGVMVGRDVGGGIITGDNNKIDNS